MIKHIETLQGISDTLRKLPDDHNLGRVLYDILDDIRLEIDRIEVDLYNEYGEE